MTIDYEVEDFLAHYGVKGMKWGVRNERKSGPSRTQQGYANRQNRKADRKDVRTKKRIQKTDDYQRTLNRIASGKKTGEDIISMYGTTTMIDIATAVVNRESLGKSYARNRQGGIDRARASQDKRFRKSDEMRAHADRILSGEASTKDMIKYLGTVNLRDTIRG